MSWLRNTSKAALLGVLGLFVGTLVSYGTAHALSTFLTVQGGTGTSSPSGILYGDNGATGHLNTVKIGSNLTFSGGTLSATGGSGGTGVATTSLLAAWPVTVTKTTGSITYGWNGLATTSAIVGGHLLYGSGVKGVANVATTTLLAGTNVSFSGGTPVIIGGSPITISASGGGGSGTVGTSTVPTVGQLAYWTSNGYPSKLGSTATTTLTAGSGISLSGTPVILGSSPITISATGGSTLMATGTPSGTVNGTNTVFTTANLPILFFVNGIYQKPGVDYTVTGSYTETMTVAPATGSILTYTYSSLGSGVSLPLSVGNGGLGFSTAPTYGQVLVGNASGGYTLTATSSLGISGGGSGTVTSVAATVPTGLTISGSPITTSGTLAFGLQTGYSIPTTASQSNWDTAYTDRITSATAPLGIASNVLSFDFTHANTWTGKQTFTNSSTTLGSFSYASSTNAYFGTLHLPTLTGTQCLHEVSGVVSGTGSDCGSGGGGTPGGSNTQLQYNNSGAFGGAAQLVWNATKTILGLGTTTPWLNKSLSIGSTTPVLADTYKVTASTAVKLGMASSSNVEIDSVGTSAYTITYSKYELAPGQKQTLVTCNGASTAGALTFSNVHYSGGVQPGNTTTANQCDMWYLETIAGTSTPIIVLTGMTSGVQ